MADEHTAHGPHQITDGEHAERGKKLGDRGLVREEVAPDRSREVAVDRKIIPLEHVADHAGGDCLIPWCDIHVIAPLIAVGEIVSPREACQCWSKRLPGDQSYPLSWPALRIRTISERSSASVIRSIDERRASVVSGTRTLRQFSENLTASSSSLSGRSGLPRLISTSSTIRLPSFVVTDRIVGACCGKIESQRRSLVTDILRIRARRVGSRINSSVKSSIPSPRPLPPIRADATV